ncbi:MAG TPA: RNA chaperone Hfq [Methanothrix sp.]|nr:RNA chaperone Hfq [Methanothrix sp.]
MEMSEDEKPTTRQSLPQFIPKFKGKKVTIRLVSGGQPVIGIVDSFNSYEIVLLTTKGEILIFKHAIATIESVDEQRGYKPNL